MTAGGRSTRRREVRDSALAARAVPGSRSGQPRRVTISGEGRCGCRYDGIHSSIARSIIAKVAASGQEGKTGMAQLRIAIQTVLVPGRDLQERFANAARFGFDGVEISVGVDDDLERQLRDCGDASRTSGLPIAAICTTRAHDPLRDDPGERSRRFDVLTQVLALAEDLGAAGVVSVPLRPARGFAGRDEQRGWLEALGDEAVSAYGDWAAGQPADPDPAARSSA